MIFSLLIIHNHDRMPVSSNTRVLYSVDNATWIYFTTLLPDRFICSSKVVREAIMSDVNDFVQEFRRTSSDASGAVGASFFAMRRLLQVLQQCYDNTNVCFDIPFLGLLLT